MVPHNPIARGVLCAHSSTVLYRHAMHARQHNVCSSRATPCAWTSGLYVCEITHPACQLDLPALHSAWLGSYTQAGHAVTHGDFSTHSIEYACCLIWYGWCSRAALVSQPNTYYTTCVSCLTASGNELHRLPF
jgi:hypothetical protein